MLAVRDTTVARLTDRKLTSCLKSYRLSFHPFSGETSRLAVSAILQDARYAKTTTIIGVGGGKCLDACKIASWELRIPFIALPTSAATCSAWTGVAPVYGEDGRYHHTIEGPSTHALILEDSLIAMAPPRLLASGMMDSLAKYYEPRDNLASIPAGATQTAFLLGESIYQTISQQGSSTLSQITHASIVQAGLAGELGGKMFRHGLAHSLYGAWTFLGLTQKYLHGELVGLGLLVELSLAGKIAQRCQLHKWMKAWRMPTALPDFARYQSSKLELKALCAHMAKYSKTVPLTNVFLKNPLKALKLVTSK